MSDDEDELRQNIARRGDPDEFLQRERTIEILASFLRAARADGLYDTAEEEAAALIRRLENKGLVILPRPAEP